ncbi:MAG: 1,6-anhydro-N-acetylmuramyl-L-alanine amidase AmpD [Pseudomonadota bacterium]|jgi:AmpD protein
MEIKSLPPTIHQSPRTAGIIVDTLVVHSMSHPESPHPEDLLACVARLDDFKVSAHYFIERSGEVWNLVSPHECAWHAGVSRMPEPDLRERVNDFSIGVELVALPENEFTEAQYRALYELFVSLRADFPLGSIVGHADIAMPPGRKTDPGPLFSWSRIIGDVGATHPNILFPGRRSSLA